MLPAGAPDGPACSTLVKNRLKFVKVTPGSGRAAPAAFAQDTVTAAPPRQAPVTVEGYGALQGQTAHNIAQRILER